ERARAVAKLGYMDVDHSAFEHAAEHFEAAQTLYKQGGHVAGEVEMRGNLAEFLSVQGRRFEAAKAYDAVLPDLNRISNNDTRVSFLLYAARAQSYAGRTDEAIANLLEALAQARKYGMNSQDGGALQALGQTYWNRGDFHQARAFFEEASKVARRDRDLDGVIYTLMDAGKVALHDGDYAAAIGMHEEAVKLAPNLKDPAGAVRAMLQLGL